MRGWATARSPARGCDAFMNCRCLHTLILRAHADEATGLPYLLNQLTAELSVEFCGDGEKKVRLLYPEYSESYEEIGRTYFQPSCGGRGLPRPQAVC